MKILVYGINYHPEEIGISKYTTEMCEWLASQGHEVEVITAMPYYPFWKVISPYASKWWHTEVINKVIVHRSPLYVPARVTGMSRILHETSFLLSSFAYWIRSFFVKYDVVVCIAPTLFTGLAGVAYKCLHRTLFLYHIQDLQVDAAKQLGLIKNKLILLGIIKFEKFILNQAHYVSTISEGMSRNIRMKGINPLKLIELKNWIDTNRMAPEEPDSRLVESFGIPPNKKIILYSGNIGEKQGLEIIITVAELLKSLDVVFLVIGDGAFKKQFEDLVKSKGLDNIRIFPLQPYELFCKVLNIAHIHLVLQKKAAADLVMPSKLTAIFAVGGVAIVTAERGTSLFEVIDQNKLAVLIEPENAEALYNAILSTLQTDTAQYRKRARIYAQTNLEKESIMTNFQKFLSQHLENTR